MDVNLKSIFKFGGLVGASVTAIGGVFAAIAYAKPIINSDWPGPLASIARVAECDGKIQKLAQNIDLQQRHIERSDQTQLFLAQGFWTQQLAIAQDRLRRHPEDVEAREHMIRAQQQLETIGRLLNQK